MPMRFSSLDYLFTSCAEHLDATGTRNTEIENYFVQHILIRICAEYEVKLKLLMERRLRTNDPATLAFAQGLMKETCKRFGVGEISGIIGRFGDQFKAQFVQRVTNHPAHVAWDNINENRQTVAHRIGVIQMTFNELETSYRTSLDIWDALIDSLGHTERELRGLR